MRQPIACLQLSCGAATVPTVTCRPVRIRHALAGFWIFAGIMHFVIPKTYAAIVPPQLKRWKREVVYASGVAELAGGVAVLPERTRTAARWWLIGTLVAIFPANVYMALAADRFKNIPEPALWARLPLQAVFGWFTWRGTR
jgi:uncharacterized membrane protein